MHMKIGKAAPMMFRLKSYLVSGLAYLAVAAFVIATGRWTMTWLTGMFPDQLAAQLAGLFLWLAACNAVFFIVVRNLRCPACTRRFGWRHYFGDGRLLPARTCPACGSDMFGGKNAYNPRDKADLRTA
jgi:hypothetical protein